MFFRILFALILLASPWPAPAHAASPSLVISELQTGTATSAAQEFIELYNPTAEDMNVDGWTVEYKAAAGSNWSQRAELTGVVKGHSFYLIADPAYLSEADAELSSGLSSTGGHVRLADGEGQTIDLLGWGNASAAETAAAPAPPAGQSLERLAGPRAEDRGNAIDRDDNAQDFVVRSDPRPQSSRSQPEEPIAAEELPADSPGESAPEPIGYQAIQITELLIDPAAPQSDTTDEFIELYNPHAITVDLKDYRLESGSNFHDHYTLPPQTMGPGAYLTIYADTSHLSLTNSGGSARLLDPAGNLLDETPAYGPAEPGQSWAAFAGGWAWTLQPTPGRENALVAPALPSVGETVKLAKAKTTAAKAKKTTAAKTSKKASAAKKSAAVKAAAVSPEASAATGFARPNYQLLILALALTMGYAIYEFRHDLRNYYYLVRRYLKARRAYRPPA